MAKILIADLVEESAFFLRALLRDTHAVSLATQSEFAIELLAGGIFDAVVADVGYQPGAPAEAVLAAANAWELPVIALAHPHAARALRADPRVTGVLAKPIVPAEVIKAVRRAVAVAPVMDLDRYREATDHRAA